jgi:hypothetical protein
MWVQPAVRLKDICISWFIYPCWKTLWPFIIIINIKQVKCIYTVLTELSTFFSRNWSPFRKNIQPSSSVQKMDSAGLRKCLPDCTQSSLRRRMRCYQAPDSFTENHTPDVMATLSPIRTKCRGSQPLAQETSHDTYSPPHLLLSPYSGWCSRLRFHIGIPDRLLSEMSVKRNLFFLKPFFFAQKLIAVRYRIMFKAHFHTRAKFSAFPVFPLCPFPFLKANGMTEAWVAQY